MAKYLVETFYTCTFKVSHYLDKIDEKELENLEKKEDGKFEILDMKIDNRKTKNLDKNLKTVDNLSDKDNQIKKVNKIDDNKNINLGKSKILIISIFFYLLTIIIVQADDFDYFGKKIDIRILDKLSSKTKLLKLNIGENYLYKNLEIKVLKCKNSKFDDNPEITTYLQVKDNKISNNDEVFVFNGRTFSSSPSIQVFDHPVYDLWILKCY